MFPVSTMYLFWLVGFIIFGQILMSGPGRQKTKPNQIKIIPNVTQAERSQFTQEWETFKRVNRLNIPTKEENIKRDKFMNNLKLIKIHNLKQSGYKLSMNEKFAFHEFRIPKAGCVNVHTDSIPTSSTICSTVKLSSISSLQTGIDWRRNIGAFKMRTTRVKDQGSCSSCWAFSAVAVFEGWYAAKTGTLEEFSPQQLMDCSRNSNKGCTLSNTVQKAFDILKISKRLETLKRYPYEGKGNICRPTHSNHTFNLKCARVAVGDEAQLREAVRQHGPVSVSIFTSLYTFKFYKSGIYYDTNCKGKPTHAVTVVGFDVIGKYWIIKNSWGEEWGERGYMKMAMDKDMCGIANYAYYAIDAHETDDENGKQKKKDKAKVGTGSCGRPTLNIFNFNVLLIIYFILNFALFSS